MTNEEIEQKALEAVRLGKKRFANIAAHVGSGVDCGAIDRVLQRLRKRAEVRYTSKDGWCVPKAGDS